MSYITTQAEPFRKSLIDRAKLDLFTNYMPSFLGGSSRQSRMCRGVCAGGGTTTSAHTTVIRYDVLVLL